MTHITTYYITKKRRGAILELRGKHMTELRNRAALIIACLYIHTYYAYTKRERERDEEGRVLADSGPASKPGQVGDSGARAHPLINVPYHRSYMQTKQIQNCEIT